MTRFPSPPIPGGSDMWRRRRGREEKVMVAFKSLLWLSGWVGLSVSLLFMAVWLGWPFCKSNFMALSGWVGLPVSLPLVGLAFLLVSFLWLPCWVSLSVGLFYGSVWLGWPFYKFFLWLYSWVGFSVSLLFMAVRLGWSFCKSRFYGYWAGLFVSLHFMAVWLGWPFFVIFFTLVVSRTLLIFQKFFKPCRHFGRTLFQLSPHHIFFFFKTRERTLASTSLTQHPFHPITCRC